MGTEVVVVVAEVVVVGTGVVVAGVVVFSLLFNEVCSLFAIVVVVDATVVGLTVVYFKEFFFIIDGKELTESGTFQNEKSMLSAQK